MPASAITSLLDAILWISTVAYAALALRMWLSGLHTRYRFFFIFVIFRTVRAVALAVAEALATTPFGSNTYGYLWLFTQPMLWFLYVLVLLELYGLVLEDYKGLATLGRWVVTGGLAVALLISSLTVGPDLNAYAQYPLLRYSAVIDRAVQSGLVIFLLFITGFLAWYPITLRRNVIVHCIVYAVYFLNGAAVSLVQNVTDSANLRMIANLPLTGISLACIVTWLVLLNPKGEQIKVDRRAQWQPGDEARLIDQLTSINAALLRAGRR